MALTRPVATLEKGRALVDEAVENISTLVDALDTA